MAGEPLLAELALDISPAIEALQPLSDALTELATNFSTALGDAISGLTELTAAPVAVTADTSELDTSIADALDAPRPPIDIEGDPTALTDSIDSAVADIAPPVVPVDADVTAAQTSVDSLSGTPIDIPVEADTSGAQDEIDSLGASATDASGSGSSSGSGRGGLLGLADASAAVGAATGLAEGNVSGLSGVVGGLGSGLGGAVTAAAGFTAFLGETVNLAADAQAQQARFNETFGAFGKQVEQINVGGLTGSLSDLAAQSGTTNAALESSASRIGALGFGSGATADQVVKTTDSILALGLQASVTNPQLGTAADVTDRLTRLLQTGGARLSLYGISLSTTAISAEALRENIGTAADQLTPFEKLAAGATLATEQLGNSIGTRFALGAQNAEVQFRALKTSITETLTAIGGPLLQPAETILSSLAPIAQSLGEDLGLAAQAGAPFIENVIVPLAHLQVGALNDLGVVLQKITDIENQASSKSGGGILGDLEKFTFGGGVLAFLDHGKKSTDDLAASADALAAKQDQVAAQTQLAGQAQAASTVSASTLTTAQKAINAAVSDGSVTLADATTVAKAYGISQAQAAQDITDAESAQDSLTASNILGTTAYGNLVDEIATGNLAIPDATAALEKMGFSADGAATAANALSSAISAAVSGIVKDLPQASDAASTWQKDLSAAFSQASSDASKHTGNIKNDLASLVADADPAKFAADLEQQTADSLQFTENIQTLLSEGLGRLAGFVAQQPLDVAGPLAKSLASNQAKAEVAQSALDLSRSVTDGAKSFFDQHASALGLDFGTQLADGVTVSGPEVGNALALLGTNVSDRFKANFVIDTNQAIAAAQNKLAADPRISQAAGEAGLKAAQSFYGPLTLSQFVSLALQGAANATAADQSVPTAAAKKGSDTAAAFKPDLSTPAGAALAGANTTISTFTQLEGTAQTLGNDVGTQFGEGMAAGIVSTATQVAIAAETIAVNAETSAKAVLGIKSPSTVGIGIGQQFVAGISLGLADTPALVVASSAIATTLVGQLKADLASLTASTSSTLSGATSSLASSALSSLPTVGNEISTFSQNLSSALSAQSSALSAVHKDYTTFGQDQQKVTDLSGKAFLAGIQLAAAQKAYDDQVKADGTKTSAAQKANLKDLSDALAVAKSAYDSFSSSVRSAQSTLSSAGQQIGTDSKALGAATKALAVDSNAATFIKNLNDQTDASKRFESDLAKLVKEGLPDLASQLADAGVATAGKLADALAASPAKAKSANAAVEHANTFATAYQKELTTLFGTSGAVTTAQTAGEATGTALTTGITSGLAAGGQSISAALNAQIAAVPKLTLNPQPITALAPVKAIAPVASSAPITLSGASISSGTQTLDLDLTIVLQDGKTVKAKTSVPVPKATGNLKQKVVAAVHAS